MLVFGSIVPYDIILFYLSTSVYSSSEYLTATLCLVLAIGRFLYFIAIHFITAVREKLPSLFSASIIIIILIIPN